MVKPVQRKHDGLRELLYGYTFFECTLLIVGALFNDRKSYR